MSLIASKCWKFKNEVGLYHDDGLLICKATPKKKKKPKQEVCQVFKSNGLKITIEANKKVVNFLDVTFNLAKGCYKPSMNIVTTATITETYVGLATNFNERYRNHQSCFQRSNRRNETELSKYFWTLQDSNKTFQIKWKILKKCKAYSNISKKCNLCLYEKFIIICKKELCSLNRRNELASSCPHRNRYVLQNSRVT